MASRIRVFGTGAGVSFVLLVVALLIPNPVVSTAAAGGFAVLGIVFALLTAATWWAGRTGATDSTDLWDSAPADTAEIEDLFTGFASFSEDGAQHPPTAERTGSQ